MYFIPHEFHRQRQAVICFRICSTWGGVKLAFSNGIEAPKLFLSEIIMCCSTWQRIDALGEGINLEKFQCYFFGQIYDSITTFATDNSSRGSLCMVGWAGSDLSTCKIDAKCVYAYSALMSWYIFQFNSLRGLVSEVNDVSTTLRKYMSHR